MSRTRLDENTLIPATSPELAEIFHKSARTVKRWMLEGILPTVRVGRSVYVRRCDIDAMLGLDDAHGNESVSTDTPSAGA